MLGNITNITDIYSMKVQRIEGKIDEEADWIGQIDPYVKFQAANRTLYEIIMFMMLSTIFMNVMLFRSEAIL